MKKFNLFITTALITLACATFTAVSAEEDTNPNAEDMQPTEIITTIDEEIQPTDVMTTITTTDIEDIVTTVPTTTETIITTLPEEELGLHIDTSKMKKFYFSDEAAFSSNGITVHFDGVDVTSEAEISFIEKPGIYDGKTFKYEINFNVVYADEVQSFTENVQIGGHGDVDMNHKVNLNDAVTIAKKILKKDYPIHNTFAFFMMNASDNDNKITLNDAVWIAKKLIENTPKSTNPNKIKTVKPLPKPDVSKYNTSTIAGVKKYANDCILYKASVYGIASEHVFFEDKVDEWHFSWNAPIIFISDMEYYKSQRSGCQPLFYKTTANGLGESLMYDVSSAVREWKDNGDTAAQIMQCKDAFTIKWKDLGHSNFEVYVMW